jgi:hypothetical protein
MMNDQAFVLDRAEERLSSQEDAGEGGGEASFHWRGCCTEAHHLGCTAVKRGLGKGNDVRAEHSHLPSPEL